MEIKKNKYNDLHVVDKRFCIKYIVNGNLSKERSWFCNAYDEDMARYYFFDRYNKLNHDIISVNIINNKI